MPKYIFNGDSVFHNGSWETIRSLMSVLSPEEFNELAGEKAVDFFLETHRFCGICGSRTEPAPDREIKYALRCSSAGCAGHSRFMYPSYSIASITLVTRKKGKELLLAHNTAWPSDRVSLLAGFMQPGETLENCVRREIKEECGLDLLSVRYINSQPWPFPSNIMTGFYAEAADGEARPDGTELDRIIWVTRDELRKIQDGTYETGLVMPRKGSLARRLAEMWLTGKV